MMPKPSMAAESSTEEQLTTKVAIVEDNPTLRQYLSELIANTPGYRCVCACGSAEEALEKIPAQRPHVVLMDIHLPGESGIACTAHLREKMPKIQVIMLTVYKDIQMIFQALKAGACGYVLKRADEKEILAAIAEVRAGGAPMTSQVARMVVRSFLEEPSDHSETEQLSPAKWKSWPWLRKDAPTRRSAVNCISLQGRCGSICRTFTRSCTFVAGPKRRLNTFHPNLPVGVTWLNLLDGRFWSGGLMRRHRIRLHLGGSSWQR